MSAEKRTTGDRIRLSATVFLATMGTYYSSFGAVKYFQEDYENAGILGGYAVTSETLSGALLAFPAVNKYIRENLKSIRKREVTTTPFSESHQATEQLIESQASETVLNPGQKVNL